MARISDRCAPGYGERLRSARKALGLSQMDVAERLAIRNSGVSKWEVEQRQIDTCSRLAIEYVVGISREYLRSGEGPMLVAQGNARPRLAEAEAALGGAVDRWLEVTPEIAAQHGFALGDYLALARVRLPEEGWCCVMSADRGHESKALVGVARPVGGRSEGSGVEWMFYRDGDLANPGSNPPVPFIRGRSLWRVLGVARRLPAGDRS